MISFWARKLMNNQIAQSPNEPSELASVSSGFLPEGHLAALQPSGSAPLVYPPPPGPPPPLGGEILIPQCYGNVQKIRMEGWGSPRAAGGRRSGTARGGRGVLRPGFVS